VPLEPESLVFGPAQKELVLEELVLKEVVMEEVESLLELLHKEQGQLQAIQYKEIPSLQFGKDQYTGIQLDYIYE
jgi:hypothetical protein